MTIRKKLIAWLWARTVRSPDPRAQGKRVPLVSSFLLSTKEGKKAWVEPVIDAAAPDGWRFEVRTGALAKADEERLKKGTKTARGREALLRLEKVFGRVQSAWLPASGDETYEIIRRRLFQPLDVEGEQAREETVKAFADLYRRNPVEFLPEAREARYTELLRLSYPIHPELFDRLSKDWASLEKFQRTRGVLRFMANVVGVLWQEQVRHPLILPARVPVARDRVRASVLYPLDPAFAAVVDKEVDGDGSLPARMEANPTRRISQARAATRAARAVFLCSAPLVGRPNAGLTGPGLRLACAEPGDQLAIFGEALRELSERATYLYEEAGRYWFSTQQTLNRVAEDRANALPAHEVDEAIVAVLRDDPRPRAGSIASSRRRTIRSQSTRRRRYRW